ncbi:MAG: hypothetical protein CW716_02925 [Candidatus Bathyarchaeum sp.]|nr:MAG: hypothetical protein CW716_02925 [Candidatus Bathyarchaeum sp.]
MPHAHKDTTHKTAQPSWLSQPAQPTHKPFHLLNQKSNRLHLAQKEVVHQNHFSTTNRIKNKNRTKYH